MGNARQSIALTPTVACVCYDLLANIILSSSRLHSFSPWLVFYIFILISADEKMPLRARIKSDNSVGFQTRIDVVARTNNKNLIQVCIFMLLLMIVTENSASVFYTLQHLFSLHTYT